MLEQIQKAFETYNQQEILRTTQDLVVEGENSITLTQHTHSFVAPLISTIGIKAHEKTSQFTTKETSLAPLLQVNQQCIVFAQWIASRGGVSYFVPLLVLSTQARECPMFRIHEACRRETQPMNLNDIRSYYKCVTCNPTLRSLFPHTDRMTKPCFHRILKIMHLCVTENTTNQIHLMKSQIGECFPKLLLCVLDTCPVSEYFTCSTDIDNFLFFVACVLRKVQRHKDNEGICKNYLKLLFHLKSWSKLRFELQLHVFQVYQAFLGEFGELFLRNNIVDRILWALHEIYFIPMLKEGVFRQETSTNPREIYGVRLKMLRFIFEIFQNVTLTETTAFMVHNNVESIVSFIRLQESSWNECHDIIQWLGMLFQHQPLNASQFLVFRGLLDAFMRHGGIDVFLPMLLYSNLKIAGLVIQAIHSFWYAACVVHQLLFVNIDAPLATNVSTLLLRALTRQKEQTKDDLESLESEDCLTVYRSLVLFLLGKKPADCWDNASSTRETSHLLFHRIVCGASVQNVQLFIPLINFLKRCKPSMQRYAWADIFCLVHAQRCCLRDARYTSSKIATDAALATATETARVYANGIAIIKNVSQWTTLFLSTLQQKRDKSNKQNNYSSSITARPSSAESLVIRDSVFEILAILCFVEANYYTEKHQPGTEAKTRPPGICQVLCMTTTMTTFDEWVDAREILHRYLVLVVKSLNSSSLNGFAQKDAQILSINLTPSIFVTMMKYIFALNRDMLSWLTRRNESNDNTEDEFFNNTVKTQLGLNILFLNCWNLMRRRYNSVYASKKWMQNISSSDKYLFVDFLCGVLLLLIQENTLVVDCVWGDATWIQKFDVMPEALCEKKLLRQEEMAQVLAEYHFQMAMETATSLELASFTCFSKKAADRKTIHDQNEGDDEFYYVEEVDYFTQQGDIFKRQERGEEESGKEGTDRTKKVMAAAAELQSEEHLCVLLYTYLIQWHAEGRHSISENQIVLESSSDTLTSCYVDYFNDILSQRGAIGGESSVEIEKVEKFLRRFVRENLSQWKKMCFVYCFDEQVREALHVILVHTLIPSCEESIHDVKSEANDQKIQLSSLSPSKFQKPSVLDDLEQMCLINAKRERLYAEQRLVLNQYHKMHEQITYFKFMQNAVLPSLLSCSITSVGLKNASFPHWKVDSAHHNYFSLGCMVPNLEGHFFNNATILKCHLKDETLTPPSLKSFGKKKGMLHDPTLYFENERYMRKSLKLVPQQMASSLRYDEMKLEDTSGISLAAHADADWGLIEPITGRFCFHEEEILYRTKCQQVLIQGTYEGRLEITKFHVYIYLDGPATTIGSSQEKNPANLERRSEIEFEASLGLVDRHFIQEYSIVDFDALFLRRHLLRRTAIEMMVKECGSSPNNMSAVFLNFYEDLQKPMEVAAILNKQYQALHASMHSNCRHSLELQTPEDFLSRFHTWTYHWQTHQLSTFDYLMILNTAAGRTFNDLSQYPIFPWILQDYTSSTLDLTSSDSFRDLSKPMGAVEKERLLQFRERSKSLFDDGNRNDHVHGNGGNTRTGLGVSRETPPFFLYGSHYSSVGSVLYYLIRLNPHTELAFRLQDGSFDTPDRLFHSIAETWRHCTTSLSDIKELVPEFFCQPAFLRNQAGLDFGPRQCGDVVNHVILPPWASDAADFVSKNREALESEFVSQHIHEWIDLIFGFKQFGSEALKADNVFYYLTYEQNLPLITAAMQRDDHRAREAIELQIANFGQVPMQLLQIPHPKRISLRNLIFSHQLPSLRGATAKSNPHPGQASVVHSFNLVSLQEKISIAKTWSSVEIDGSIFMPCINVLTECGRVTKFCYSLKRMKWILEKLQENFNMGDGAFVHKPSLSWYISTTMQSSSTPLETLSPRQQPMPPLFHRQKGRPSQDWERIYDNSEEGLGSYGKNTLVFAWNEVEHLVEKGFLVGHDDHGSVTATGATGRTGFFNFSSGTPMKNASLTRSATSVQAGLTDLFLPRLPASATLLTPALLVTPSGHDSGGSDWHVKVKIRCGDKQQDPNRTPSVSVSTVSDEVYYKNTLFGWNVACNEYKLFHEPMNRGVQEYIPFPFRVSCMRKSREQHLFACALENGQIVFWRTDELNRLFDQKKEVLGGAGVTGGEGKGTPASTISSSSSLISSLWGVFASSSSPGSSKQDLLSLEAPPVRPVGHLFCERGVVHEMLLSMEHNVVVVGCAASSSNDGRGGYAIIYHLSSGQLIREISIPSLMTLRKVHFLRHNQLLFQLVGADSGQFIIYSLEGTLISSLQLAWTNDAYSLTWAMKHLLVPDRSSRILIYELPSFRLLDTLLVVTADDVAFIDGTSEIVSLHMTMDDQCLLVTRQVGTRMLLDGYHLNSVLSLAQFH